MSMLTFDEYTKYTRPLSAPIARYTDPKDLKDYYRKIVDADDEISDYNLEYNVLANQDLALDLLHIAFLYDREIKNTKMLDIRKKIHLLNENLYTSHEISEYKYSSFFYETENDISNNIFFFI